MAKNTYKKRMRGDWNQGKACKGDGEERLYAKQEIKTYLAEMDEDYLAPYKKSKRRRNEKARLEHRIAWAREALERRKENGRNMDDWFSNWIRSDLEKDLKRYKEKFGGPKPLKLECPMCNKKHVDKGEWATDRWHKTHLCGYCKHEWRPSEEYTVGI